MLPVYQNTNNNVSKSDIVSFVLPNNYDMAARPGASVRGALDENAYAVELGFDAPPERSSNLEMLSEELERQTRETQKLQEQVEHATKRTMERMGRTLGGVTPHMPKTAKLHSMGVLPEVSVPEVHVSGQDFRVQPDMYDHDLGLLKHNMKHSGKDVAHEYSQQVSELQQHLNTTHALHEQQNIHLRQSIMKLQTKLQESQLEMDALLEQRVKESHRQADLVGKLQGTIRELQGSKQVADHMLLEAENQVELLCRKQEALDQTLQEVGSALLDYEKRVAKRTYMDKVSASPGLHSLGKMVGTVLQDLVMENASLKEKLLPIEEQLGVLQLEFQEKNVFMMKEQTERKEAERQASTYHSQKTELESSVSILRSELLEAQQTQREKVSAVEKQLSQAVSNMEEAEKQKELYRQQVKDMESRVSQLTTDLHKTQEELALEKEQNRRLRERDRSHSVAIDGLRQELDGRSLGVLELENMVGSLKDECLTLMEKQISAEKQQSKMQDNATRLRSELKAARDQLQLADLEHTRERATKDEKERDGKRLLSLQQEQQHEVKMLQGQLEEQGHQVKMLQGQLEEKEREIKRLQVLLEEQGCERKRIKGLMEDQDCEKKRLNDLLEAQQGEGKRLQDMLENQEHKMKRLKGLLDEQRQKGKRVQGLLEEKECEGNKLQRLLEEQKQEEKRLHDLLEEQKQEQVRLKGLLEGKEQELQQKEQNQQQDEARLQEAQGHAQALMAEGDTLRLKLEEKEKMVELLQLQMEGMTQLSLQHSNSIEVLQEEKEWLISEIDKHQLEIHQLKAGWEQQGHMLGALEHEQVQQKGALSEKNRSLHELTLQKQRLTTELEVQRVQLLSLTDEHEALKKTHVRRIQELEGIAAKLMGQLQTVQADLFQAQSTLRTLEGADEHGMKVALGMQRRITAKREQIDTLQGRIQMMEENTDKLTKDKRQQAAECKRLSQQLTSVTAEKKQLENEVEALRYLEKQLRDKMGKLEGALDKMSERFSECQDFIQQQEQQFMCLKLQHALDLKEQQGQNLRVNGNLQLSPKCNSPVPTQLLHFQKITGQLCKNQPDNPTLELKTLVKELRSVIDEDDRSSPMNRNELVKDNIVSTSANRKTTSSRDPLTLHTADLEEGNSNGTFSSDGYELSFPGPPHYTSSPRGPAVGCRSPVHSLLTSTPHPSSPTKPQLENGGPYPDLNTRKACKKLQGKLDSMQSLVDDLQNKAQEMSSMIKTEETRMRSVKDRSKLSNGLDSD
ncbi:coiled-coil domain-containing protein 158-like isoform X2 [Anguilla rostrata]|uniref:coiled-coil domain-containing protein 158-like isoform X2 n=1 Tax=Anguilla rostrata TaxID=7938 RepID=UPI0030D2084E